MHKGFLYQEERREGGGGEEGERGGRIESGLWNSMKSKHISITPSLGRQFEASPGYIVKPCLEQTKTKFKIAKYCIDLVLLYE